VLSLGFCSVVIVASKAGVFLASVPNFAAVTFASKILAVVTASLN
jgi:hypothetical protein